PPVRPGEGAVGRTFRSGAPVLVENYAEWEHALPESKRRGMVAAVAVPLVVEDRPVGAMGVWTYEPRTFGEDDVRLLQLLAAHVAPTLEGARLAEEARARAEMFEALHEVAVASSGLLDLDVLARTVVDRSAAILHCDGAGLWWWDPEARVLRRLASQGLGSDSIGDLPAGQGAAGRAFELCQAVCVEDYQAWEGARADTLAAGVG